MTGYNAVPVPSRKVRKFRVPTSVPTGGVIKWSTKCAIFWDPPWRGGPPQSGGPRGDPPPRLGGGGTPHPMPEMHTTTYRWVGASYAPVRLVSLTGNTIRTRDSDMTAPMVQSWDVHAAHATLMVTTSMHGAVASTFDGSVPGLRIVLAQRSRESHGAGLTALASTSETGSKRSSARGAPRPPSSRSNPRPVRQKCRPG